MLGISFVATPPIFKGCSYLLILRKNWGKEMQTGISVEVGSVIEAAETRGKHTISAELKRLEQEIRFLEEELGQLEQMEKASSACTEMLITIEANPDPLLPETTGPINPVWDRWFEGPQDSSSCRCWIL